MKANRADRRKLGQVRQKQAEPPMTKVLRERAVQFIGMIIWKTNKDSSPAMEIRLDVDDIREFDHAFKTQEANVQLLGEGQAVVLRLVDNSGMPVEVKVDEERTAALRRKDEALRNAPMLAARLMKEFEESSEYVSEHDEPKGDGIMRNREILREAARALFDISGPHEDPGERKEPPAESPQTLLASSPGGPE